MSMNGTCATQNEDLVWVRRSSIYSSPAAASVLLGFLWNLRLLFRNQLLKARIVPDRVPGRIKAQVPGNNLGRRRKLHQPFQNRYGMIGIAEHRVDPRHGLLSAGAFKWIFRTRLYGDAFLSFGYSQRCLAQPGISDAQVGM